MKKLIIIVLILIIAGFLFWTFSPNFIDREVDDALPTVTEDRSPLTEEDMQEIIASMPDKEMDESMPVEAELAATPEPERTNTIDPGPFPIIDTPGHRATGNIRVVDTGAETIVRYENYDGTNGPDLYVYLTNDLDAESFVSLGRARANKGNINYSVPENIDVSEYRYVVTWCQAFGVLFDYAEIN